MGAEKLFKKILFFFAVIILELLVLCILMKNLVIIYNNDNSSGMNKFKCWIFLFVYLIIISFIFICMKKSFDMKLLFRLTFKKKDNLNNCNNNLDNEDNYFVRKLEYSFTETKIRKNQGRGLDFQKKIVSCIEILHDNKIIIGFSEGTILVCSLNENSNKLIQNFSFNRFKTKQIIFICESCNNDGEIFVSVKESKFPIKVIKLNLNYNYSCIKVLARDKPYIVLQEIAKKLQNNNNNNNNNLNSNNDILLNNKIFKIIPFTNDKFITCDQKCILLKEKIKDFESDEYISTKQHIKSNDTDIIYDIIKINEDTFATFEYQENENNTGYVCFYDLNNFDIDKKKINGFKILPNMKSRLCLLTERLIAVLEDNFIVLINMISMEKIKEIPLENIIGIGIDVLYDGSIITMNNVFEGNLHCFYIAKVCRRQENLNMEEYESVILSNSFWGNNGNDDLVPGNYTCIKCTKNSGLVILTDDKSRLSIWEEVFNH